LKGTTQKTKIGKTDKTDDKMEDKPKIIKLKRKLQLIPATDAVDA
jgi:hypothetical protein